MLRGTPLLPAAMATLLFALALLIDRLPRFYQGDSTAYLTTGMSGWIPPDRSWAYGFGSRWLVELTGSASALAFVQAALMLGAVLLACRAFAAGAATRAAILAFAVIASLDPLTQAYARSWLSDTPAAAAFICFTSLLAMAVTAPARRFRRLMPALAACAVFAVFIRVAYAPIIAGLLLLAAAAVTLAPGRDRPAGVRRRLLALIALPVAALAMLAVANSIVAIPALRGKVFVNRMSDLYTLGVFLPALRQEDFVRAGVPITQAEFDGLDRSLDAREAQVWNDGPGHVRWLIMQKLGVDQVLDSRVQDACAAIVRTALRRHPQDFVLTYVRSLAMYFDPGRWIRLMPGELGFERDLPDWAVNYLTGVTGRPVSASITRQPSPLTVALTSLAGIYPFLLAAGLAASAAVLAFARPFGPRHVIGAAIIATLLITPLFSHALKPRYVLAAVTLSELLLILQCVTPALMRRARAACATPALPAAAAAVIIAAYVGQLDLARWQTDEFGLFADLRESGWGAFTRRMLYAPRPFSEAVLALYGTVVNLVLMPLAFPFLAMLWAGVTGLGALAARSVLPPSPHRLLAALALPAALFAFVLTTNEVTEVFYWPMSAAAYLPVAGAATVLLFLLSRRCGASGHGLWNRSGCCAALLVAAGSNEMGAALAIGFAAAAAVDAAARPGGARIEALRAGLWWALPGIVGLTVLYSIASHRLNVVELGSDTQPYTGRLLASMGMTLRQSVLDVLGGYGASTPQAMLAALASKLLFAFGFAAVWRGAGRDGGVPGRWHGVLAASLIASAGFSILAAYYHYGTLCCERQATTRFWLVDLLLILAAAWGLARWRWARLLLDRRAWLAPALLAVALHPVFSRIGGLRQDYALLNLAREGAAKTWQSGLKPGTAAMEFYLPPDENGMLVRGTSQNLATFHTRDGAPDLIRELGRFFQKTVIVTCQPWQNEKSWLLNGQFIPSCPPRDGPPDVVYPPP